MLVGFLSTGTKMTITNIREKTARTTNDLSWDDRLIHFMSIHSTTILRYALAVVFIWFGALKALPGVSPAEALAGRTIEALTFGILKPSISLPLLAILEVSIGFGFLFGKRLKLTLALLMFQMAGTVTPFLLFPHECMTSFGVPTMTGQYILKNMVFVAAGLVLLGTLKRTQEPLP